MARRLQAETAKRQFKDAAYGRLSRVAAAISNKSRLEMMELLAQRPRTVQDVALEAGLSVANASQHLQVLTRVGLVSVARRGTYAYYRAADEAVLRLLAAVRDVADRHSDGDEPNAPEILRRRPEGITDLAKARALVRETRTVLLDVRPAEEFDVGHVPGAVSAPLDALTHGRIALSRSKHYVVYCRGAYCLFADEAVAYLERRGLRATRLALGTIDWVAAGETLERAG